MAKGLVESKPEPCKPFAKRMEAYFAEWETWRPFFEAEMIEAGQINLQTLAFDYWLMRIKACWLFLRNFAQDTAYHPEIWEWWQSLHIVNKLEVIDMGCGEGYKEDLTAQFENGLAKERRQGNRLGRTMRWR